MIVAGGSRLVMYGDAGAELAVGEAGFSLKEVLAAAGCGIDAPTASSLSFRESTRCFNVMTAGSGAEIDSTAVLIRVS